MSINQTFTIISSHQNRGSDIGTVTAPIGFDFSLIYEDYKRASIQNQLIQAGLDYIVSRLKTDLIESGKLFKKDEFESFIKSHIKQDTIISYLLEDRRPGPKNSYKLPDRINDIKNIKLIYSIIKIDKNVASWHKKESWLMLTTEKIGKAITELSTIKTKFQEAKKDTDWNQDHLAIIILSFERMINWLTDIKQEKIILSESIDDIDIDSINF